MTASAMPADRFWQIIERAARSAGDPEAHMEALHVGLRERLDETVTRATIDTFTSPSGQNRPST